MPRLPLAWMTTRRLSGIVGRNSTAGWAGSEGRDDLDHPDRKEMTEYIGARPQAVELENAVAVLGPGSWAGDCAHLAAEQVARPAGLLASPGLPTRALRRWLWAEGMIRDIA